MHNGPTNPRSESTNTGLRQNQGDSDVAAAGALAGGDGRRDFVLAGSFGSFCGGFGAAGMRALPVPHRLACARYGAPLADAGVAVVARHR